MASLIDLTMQKTNAPKMGITQQSAVHPQSIPMPADSVNLSLIKKKEKKKQNDGFLNAAAFLAFVATAVAGGTYGSIKFYDRFLNKLVKSGIKKGEIKEALFNFIKKSDPKGELFFSKEEILKINSTLTDENFLILKQLSKMKQKEFKGVGRHGKARFSLKEITELLTSTNKDNIKHLTRLAEKQEDKTGRIVTLTTQDIIDVLKEINPANEKVAADLIDKAEVSKIYELTRCLKKVDNNNVETYSLLLSTRRKGGVTELSFNDMDILESQIREYQNPNCAELFINAEKKDGSGDYRHNASDISEFLTNAKEEHLDTYKKMYELRGVIKDAEMNCLIKSVNKDNFDILEPMLTKEIKGSAYPALYDGFVFKDYNVVEDILKATNEKNIEVVKSLLGTINEKGRPVASPDKGFLKVVKYINQSDSGLREVESLIENKNTFSDILGRLSI